MKTKIAVGIAGLALIGASFWAGMALAYSRAETSSSQVEVTAPRDPRANGRGYTEIRIWAPTCFEDETALLGRGDFHNGHWSRYVCLHSDSVLARSPNTPRWVWRDIAEQLDK